MKRKALLHLSLFVSLVLALTHASHAQLIAGPGVTDTTSSQPVSNRTFSFSGTIPGQLDGSLSVTFSIYPDQQTATALWTETQVVQITAEKYSVMLGSTSATGLPSEIFSADQSHWLGVQVNGTEKRYLLVSVPYAMKAVNADQLGGLPFSEYVTAQQLQAALQGAIAGTTTQPKATTTAPTGQAAAAGTPPQPATDFTDNNTSEVLLVTQQGTGFAIHAITSGDAALFAENSNTSGTALKVLESASTGLTVGILAQTSSPEGIPAIFDNTSGQGGILRLQSNGNIVTTFSHLGDINTTGEILASRFNGDGSGLVNIPASAINATPGNFPNSVVARDTTGSFAANRIFAVNFQGDGSGLFNIPQSAIGATSFNNPNTVVARDSTASFAANQIFAVNFQGDGSGLFNIPQSAIGATSFNNPNTVVARDSTASFAANQIFAVNFQGDGSGLFNIPQSAIGATSFNNPNTVVARDSTASFAANQIFAVNFLGNGSGLFNIPQSAIGATSFNNPNTVVARDSTASFAANQIFANMFSGNGFGLVNVPMSAINATSLNQPNTVVARDANGGFAAGNLQVNQLTSSGLVDFSGAVTFPVRTVLTANIPPLCFASKELLLVTDAFPGQQLFVCNSNGNGWVLLGDGGGSAGSSNVSGNTTGTLENVSQLGSGTALTVSSTSGAAVSASSTNGTAIQGGSTGVGVQGSSQGGIGIWAQSTANDSTGTALLLSHASLGKLIDGGVSLGSGTDIFETFSVTAEGDVTFNGAMMTPYETTGTWFSGSLAKLTSIPGNFGAGTVATTSPGDTSGAIGIITGLPASGSRIQVVQSGQMNCNFDGPATAGDYVGISKTVAGECTDIGATFPTDGQQVVGRVLSFNGPIGANRILLFESETHGGVGTGSGVTINTGAGLTGGPITSSGTISVADGGITAAKLAPNAVTSINIADNSIPPSKIAGTAATLGNNSFNGTQSMLGINVNGFVNLQGSSNSFIGISNSSGTALQVQGGNVTDGAIVARSSFRAIDTSSTFGYGLFSFSPNGVGVYANGGETGVQAETVSGTALAATVNNQGGTIGTAGSFTVLGSGTILSGRSGAQQTEVFNVDTAGNLLSNGNFLSFGSLTTQYPNSPTGTIVNSLVKLTPNGFAVSTSAGDSGGAIGIAIAGAGTTGNVQIAYAGRAMCQFDNNPGAGDYVGISRSQTGMCVDLGQSIPTSSGQIIGRIISAPPGVVTGLRIGQVLLFNSDTRGGTVTSITAGPGLTGGLISSSGVIGIATGGVNNFMLQNSSITVVPGSGLAGGGAVPLGSSVTLSNAGVLSFNGRSGGVVAAPGDYSFAQIAGTASASQLPSTTVYNNQSNTFTTDQTIQGNLGASGNINTGGSVTANAFAGPSANFTGAATSTNSVLAVNDTGASGSAISVNSANNPAALFISSGPTVFMAGRITGATTILSSNGDLTLNGTAHATSFSGDGSALTNVSAARIGTLAPSDIATNAALSAETTARQNADTSIQSSVASETSARQSADTTLQNNINAETTARASTDASLQANINSVSSASAQLAAANTFTAKQTLAASTTTSASLNVPAGSPPSSPTAGDVWNTGSTLQYRDNASTTRSLVSTSQSGGLQLLKLTASITPTNVNVQSCTEQSFTVSGISSGDTLLSVLQPATSSPGTNIAIGGFRVSTANTVAIQFCNVSRNNGSTPTAGVYTFAFMR